MPPNPSPYRLYQINSFSKHMELIIFQIKNRIAISQLTVLMFNQKKKDKKKNDIHTKTIKYKFKHKKIL